MNNLKCVKVLQRLIIVLTCAYGAEASADIIKNNAFLFGKGVELGIGSDAAFGSDIDALEGYYKGTKLGFISDNDLDGFENGYDGDYFTPGSPEEGWGISINGVHYNNNNNIQSPEIKGVDGAESGIFSNFVNKANYYQAVDWTGAVQGLTIKKTYQIYVTGTVIFVDVELENTSAATMNNVYYMRTVDPDNNYGNKVRPTNTYVTHNTIDKQGDVDGFSYVKATQPDGSTLSLLGYAHDSRVAIGGNWNRNPVAVYYAQEGLIATGDREADESISLAFKFDEIEPGHSVKLRYSYNLSASDLVTLSSGSGSDSTTYTATYFYESDPIKAMPETVAIENATLINEVVINMVSSQNGDMIAFNGDLPKGISVDSERTDATRLAFIGSSSPENYLSILKQITYTNTLINQPAENLSFTPRKITAHVLGTEFAPSNQIESTIFVSSALKVDMPIMGDNVINLAELPDMAISGTSAPLASVVVTLTDISGNQIKHTVTTDNKGVWQLALSESEIVKLNDGSLTLDVAATDENGVSSTARHPVTKDTIVETLVITGGIDLINDKSFNAAELEPFLVEGTAEPGTVVDIRITDEDGKVIDLQAVADENGDWKIESDEVKTLKDGPLDIILSQTDPAGNRSDNALVVDKDVTIYVTITGSETADDGVLNTMDNNKLQLQGDGEAEAAIVVTVTDKEGKQVVAETTVDENGNWSFSPEGIDVSGLADGPLAIDVKASDEAGNVDTETYHPVVKDTNMEVLVITGGVDLINDKALNASELEPFLVEGTADPGTVVDVRITDEDGKVIDLQAVADDEGHWKIESDDVKTLKDGPLDIILTQTDPAGNRSEQALTSDKDMVTDVKITGSETADDGVLNGADNGKLQLQGDGEPGATIVATVTDKDGKIVVAETTVDENGNWSFGPEGIDVSTLADGPLTVNVKATDQAGNIATETYSQPIVKDMNVNDVSLLTPGDNGVVDYQQPTIEGMAEPGSTVRITNGQGDVLCTTTSDESSQWSCTLPPMELDTADTLTISIEDTSGNTDNITTNIVAGNAEDVQRVKAVLRGAGHFGLGLLGLLALVSLRRRARYLLLLSGLLALSTSAHSNSLKDDWYVGGGIGYSHVEPEVEGTAWQIDSSNDVSFKGYVGKGLNNVLSLEGFFVGLGNASLDNDPLTGDVSYTGFGGSLVYRPITVDNRWTPFAKIGVGSFSTKSSGDVNADDQNSISVISGVGLDYHINKNLKLRAEYEMFDEDARHFSVGLNWSFGAKSRSVKKQVAKRVVPSALPAVKAPLAKKVVMRESRPPVVNVVQQKPVVIVRENTVYRQAPTPKPIIQKVYVPQKPIIQKVYVPQKPIIQKVYVPQKPVIQKVYVPQKPAAPAPRAPQKITKRHTLTGGSYFATGSSQLTRRGMNAIAKMVKDLNNSGYRHQYITVTGHTDNVGSNLSNLRLSERRAQAVANYMQRLGIPGNLLQTKGMGEEQPIQSNATSFGRSKNRRVEVIISAQKTFYK